MRLTGPQFEQLTKALLEAFDTRENLTRMVKFGFGLNLEAIADGDNLTDVVYGLIKWAEDEQKVAELIACARAQRPDNERLLACEISYKESLTALQADADPQAQARNQVLERLTEDFGVDLVVKGARRVRARGRRLFDDLLTEHKIFGGRQRELARLDRFVDQRQSGYIFVTGPTGFGKTALLSNWAQMLASRPMETAIHFITPIVDAGEKFCFENLCEQLLAFHGLGGELPEREKDLRLLYADLLRLPLPPERRLIVMLDGLDETLGHWEPRAPRADMFPQDLAAGVQVVFSAGTIADKDWLADFNLTLSTDRVLSLGPLRLDEVEDMLVRSRLVAGDNGALKRVTQRLYELSEGDPFYLRELLKQAGTDVEQLKKPPVGLDNYLKQWWKEAGKASGEQAFTDLMGTLAVARAPLGRQELISLSDADAIRGANFDLLLEQASRYVIGSELEGYQLSHGRIREFVYDRLADVIDDYRSRMAVYCLRWNQPDLAPRARDYMLLHAAQHLAEARDWASLRALLSVEWIRVKWDRFGSYSALIHDLDIATATALEQEPADVASVAALVVARQTAREIMLSFPTTLLTAWIGLGEIERVLTLLGALGAVKGRAVEPLTAVAAELLEPKKADNIPEGQEVEPLTADDTPADRAVEPLTAVAAELLELKKAGNIPAGQIDVAQVAANLLGRALGMLAAVSSSIRQLEALEAIVKLLGAESELADAQRDALLEQAEHYAQNVREPAQQAAALGMVAAAIASSATGREPAQRLVEQARQAIQRIDYNPDRMVAMAYLLPALTQLDPDESLAAFSSTLDASSNPFEASSLGNNPLGLLIAKWVPVENLDQQSAITLLQAIGELGVSQDEPEGFLVGQVALKLCELGQGQAALDLISSLWARSPIEGARAVIKVIQALHTIDAISTLDWLAQAQAFTDYAYHDFHISRGLFTAGLANSLATIGQWEPVLDLLSTVRPMERDDAICDCLRLAGTSLGTDLPRLRSIVQQLVALGKDNDLADQAKIYATAGWALLLYDLPAAKSYINQAAALCLADLPEGDTDDLRQLLAVALHEDGDYTGACAAVAPLKWGQNAVETYARMIDRTPATATDMLSAYAEGMLRMLRATEGKTLFYQALLKAAPAVTAFSERIPVTARSLCDYIYQAIYKMSSYDDFINCSAAEAAARASFDLPVGLAHFDALIHQVKRWLAASVDVNIYAVVAMIKYLGSVASVAPTETLERLELIGGLATFFPSITDRVNLQCASAVALMPIQAERAVGILRAQFAAITELSQAPPLAPHISRMIAEFTGRLVGPRQVQARTAKDIGDAVIAIGGQAPDEAAALLGELLVSVQSIDSLSDRAQALADFFEECGRAPTELQQRLTDVYAVAVEQAGSLPDPELATNALSQAVDALCRSGNIEGARRVADHLQDIDAKARAENTIDIAEERLQLGLLSFLNQMFVEGNNTDLLFAVVHAVYIEGTTKEVLAELIELLAHQYPWERSRLLGEGVRSLIVPAYSTGGTALVRDLIETIEDFDQRFLQVAALVGQQK